MSTVLLWLAVAFVVYALLYFAAVVVSRALAHRLVTRGGRTLRYRMNAWLPRALDAGGVGLFGVMWFPGASAGAPLVAHEARHGQQEHACGYIGYPFAILASWLVGGYRGSRMEEDARAYALTHWRDFPDLRATDSTSTGGVAGGTA